MRADQDRRANVFKLAGYLGEFDLWIDPEAILAEMQEMEGLAPSHTRSEVWAILGELRKLAEGARPR